MAELQIASVEFVMGEGVEHEGVVGVGAVADVDQSLGHRASRSETAFFSVVRTAATAVMQRAGFRGRTRNHNLQKQRRAVNAPNYVPTRGTVERNSFRSK